MYDDDDWDDDDYDDDEFDEDDPDAWYECPLCGADVYEEADVCPACGDYIKPKLVSRSDARPMWYVFLGLAGILAVVLVLSGLIRFIW
jgi:hypothetical protein